MRVPADGYDRPKVKPNKTKTTYITYSRSGNSLAESLGGACAASTAPQRSMAAMKPARILPSRMRATNTSIAACHSACRTFCAIP